MKNPVILILAILILLSQALLLRRLARSWAFPPALYALYWALITAASIVIRFEEYALTPSALLVFLAGSGAFSCGGIVAVGCLGRAAEARNLPPSRKDFMQSCILVYSLVLLALVPVFVTRLIGLASSSDILEIAVATRVAFGESGRGGIPRYFQSLASVGAVLAYVAAWLYDGSRRDKAVLALGVAAPLSMSTLTLSRSPVYMLVVGVLGILAFRGKVRRGTLLASLVAGLALAIGMGMLLGKGPTFEPGKSALRAIAENVAVYFVGGPVGFGQVMGNPASVGDHGLSLRFFTQLAHSLGAPITLPDNVLGYFSDALGNVYTIYFAYWLDGGWWGVVLVAFLAGFVCTGVYVLGRKGRIAAGVSLGLVIAALLNSATGDGLFGTAMPWILIVAVVEVLRIVPTVGFRFSGGASGRGAGAGTAHDEGSR